MRRLLSYMFMALAFLCFAMPVFAQGAEAAGAVNWVAITAGFSMAIASGLCALGQAKPRHRRPKPGAQSRSPARNPAGADSRSGADRVAGALHPGDHLRQGEVGIPGN